MGVSQKAYATGDSNNIAQINEVDSRKQSIIGNQNPNGYNACFKIPDFGVLKGIEGSSLTLELKDVIGYLGRSQTIQWVATNISNGGKYSFDGYYANSRKITWTNLPTGKYYLNFKLSHKERSMSVDVSIPVTILPAKEDTNLTEAQKVVESLFSDNTHTQLSEGVTKEKIDQARKLVLELNNSEEKNRLLQLIDKANSLLNDDQDDSSIRKKISEWFPSNYLAASIAQQLGAKNGVNTIVTKKELNKIESLVLLGDYSEKKHDPNLLKGIEHLNNLNYFDMIDFSNLTSDILKELTKIPNLIHLNFDQCYGENRTTIFSKLPHLEKLRVLSYTYGEVSYSMKDIEKVPLISPNIEGLNLYNTSSIVKISSLEFLGKLTTLKTLTLRNVGLHDIDYLETLVNLESIDLTGNNITDYSVLGKLPNLKEVIK